MSLTFAAIVHLERLPNYEVGHTYFGLNVQYGLRGKPDADDEWETAWDSFLRPWVRAKNEADPTNALIRKVALWVEGSGLEIVDVLPAPKVNPGARWTELFGRYDREYEALIWPEGRTAKPNHGPARLASDLDTAQELDLDAPSWPILLAQASRYPAPVAAVMGLSCVFRVPQDLAGKVILGAAPVFECWVPVDTDPVDGVWEHKFVPDDCGEAKNDGIDQPSALVSVLPAFVVPASPRPPDADSLLDLDRYLVFDPGGKWNSRAGEDWVSRARGGLALQFDLGQRLIDFLRSHSGVLAEYTPGRGLDEKEWEARRWGLVDAVLAALRDLADCGLRGAGSVARPAFAAGSEAPLFGQALDLLGPVVSPDARDLIHTAVEAYEASLDLGAWRVLIRETVDEGRGLRVLADRREPGSYSDDVADEILGELESIQSALSQDHVLRKVVLRQWSEAVKAWDVGAPKRGKPLVGSDWARLAGPVERDALPALDVRSILERTNFDPLWPVILDIPLREHNEFEAFRGLARDAMADYVRARFGGVPRIKPHPHSDLQPKAAPLGTPLVERLAKVLSRYTYRFIEARYGVGRSVLAERPQSIAVQVDRLSSAMTDVGDAQRSLSGVGLLLRRSGGMWRMPNVADLIILDGSGGEEPAFEYAAAPVRTEYQEELRQSFIRYDNHPLVADSPASELVAETIEPIETQNETDGLLDAELLRFALPDPGVRGNPSQRDVTHGAWAKLPTLVYGASYEALPYLIGNSGALPPLLADAASPTDAKAHDDFIKAFDTWVAGGDQWKQYVQTVEYRRQVGVAAPAWSSGERDGTKKAPVLPAVPDGVRPLVRDLGTNTDPLVDWPRIVGMSDDVSKAPLLLLWDAGATPRRTAEYWVGAPRTDLENWHRWISKDIMEARNPTSLEALRKRVWVEVFKRRGQDSGTKPDDSVDDPCVDGLVFVLDPVFLRSQQPHPAPLEVDFVAATPGPGLEEVRRNPISVQCSISNGAPTLALVEGAVHASVPVGEVWTLTAYARVPRAKADGRFHKKLLQAGPTVAGSILEQLAAARGEEAEPPYLLSAHRIVVEVAHDQMPTPAALWDATYAAINEADRTVSVGIDPMQIAESAYLLKEIEVRRQVWRWNGIPPTTRPPSPGEVMDPPPPPAAAATPALIWEAEGFGHRRDLDHLRLDRQARYGDPPGYPGGIAGHSPLYTEQLSGDPRALYYRFGILAHSRYRKLFGTPAVEAKEARTKTKWRRALMPARLPEDGRLDAPGLRVVLPTTVGPEGDQSTGAASLLVLLEEPWYDRFGLHEELQGEIVLYRDPATNKPGEQAEAALDPILFTAPFPGSTSAQGGKRWANQTDRLKITGPIGLSFDTDTDARLFTGTAFLVDVIPPEEDADMDLGWLFARLRFRRHLPGYASVEADWTPSEWVQLLPDSSRWHVGWGDGSVTKHAPVSKLSFRKGGTGASYRFCDPDGQALSWIRADASDAPDDHAFSLWVMGVRTIFDAGGQERLELGGFVPVEANAKFEFPSGLDRVRLVSVQHAPDRRTEAGDLVYRDTTDEASLLEAMFPSEADDRTGPVSLRKNAGARWVRVSPFIDRLASDL